MTPIRQNALLGSDLDAQGNQILNLGELDPVPLPLVDTDDSRLSDARAMKSGSVVDLSVSAVAGIKQSKLSLNGVIPPAWVGTNSGQAAKGSLVQLKAQKGAAGGYAPLAASGRLSSSLVTATGNPGTVNTVALAMPTEFSVANSPLSAAGTLAVTWRNVPNASWFGLEGVISPAGGPAAFYPSFKTSKIPLGLIPSLDGSKFTSGIFDTDMLPVAVSVGSSHAPGLVPDPGEKGNPSDYLGRDMKWRSFGQNLSYQPQAPLPQITLAVQASPGLFAVVVSADKNCFLFYRVNGGPNFIEVHVPTGSENKITLLLVADDFVEAYAARAGMNNSDIASFNVELPLPSPGS